MRIEVANRWFRFALELSPGPPRYAGIQQVKVSRTVKQAIVASILREIGKTGSNEPVYSGATKDPR